MTQASGPAQAQGIGRVGFGPNSILLTPAGSNLVSTTLQRPVRASVLPRRWEIGWGCPRLLGSSWHRANQVTAFWEGLGCGLKALSLAG